MKVKYITHVIPSTKYKLVNLNQVFAYSHIEYVKNIFKNQLSNKSVIKKYFYHTYITNICKCIIDNNKNYIPVLVFTPTHEDISTEEQKMFDKFNKMFPVQNIVITVNFDYFIKSLDDSGMREEISNIIFSNQDKISRKKFYFSKIEKFCQKYELTFLDKKFFGDIKNKMLMI